MLYYIKKTFCKVYKLISFKLPSNFFFFTNNFNLFLEFYFAATRIKMAEIN